MKQLTLVARGFAIVFLTSLNITQVSAGHYAGAFAAGGAISWVWFSNSRTAAHTALPYARVAYAAGAALGTVAGMWVGRGGLAP